MARHRHQFTIYDALDAKGVFEANPANPSSRDQITGEALYQGPVKYPMMLYHPLGDEIVTVPAEIVVTPMGPQRVGEQRRIIHKIVKSEQEEKELLAAGWHNHPAKSIKARLVSQNLDVADAPVMSSDQRIKDLEEMIRKLQAEKGDVSAKLLSEERSSGKAVGVKQVEPKPKNILAPSEV